MQYQQAARQRAARTKFMTTLPQDLLERLNTFSLDVGAARTTVIETAVQAYLSKKEKSK
jgi:metal-responsive CopG/Arc/MetJ family transcriptional regulator